MVRKFHHRVVTCTCINKFISLVCRSLLIHISHAYTFVLMHVQLCHELLFSEGDSPTGAGELRGEIDTECGVPWGGGEGIGKKWILIPTRRN